MSVYMPLDCDGFAAVLADYLEGDAPDAVRAAVEAHAEECADCRALLADLRVIPERAAALPALAPSRDLWSGIAERIDAHVLPLDRPAARRVAPARRSWARPAIAAAALVVATAGITHYLTRVSVSAPVVASVSAPSIPARESTTAIPSRVASSAPSAASPSVGDAGVPATGRAAAPRRSERAPATMAPTGPMPASGTARLARADGLMRETEPVYDREIAKLRTIVTSRRSQLDPKTVAVLEQSIAVIDSAIAQSRAALANDPASGFLAEQLNHSLEKKVELLRTAAMLPART